MHYCLGLYSGKCREERRKEEREEGIFGKRVSEYYHKPEIA